MKQEFWLYNHGNFKLKWAKDCVKVIIQFITNKVY